MALTLQTSGGNGGDRPRRRGTTADPTGGSATRWAAKHAPIVVSQAELAAYLGISGAQVVALWRQGLLTRAAAGASDYELKPNVRAYIDRLRARHASNKGEAELELTRLRAEELRQRIRDWRLDYGRRVAAETANSQASGLAELRARLEAWEGSRHAIEAIDAILDALDALDRDAIAQRVEGARAEEDAAEEAGDESAAGG